MIRRMPSSLVVIALLIAGTMVGRPSQADEPNVNVAPPAETSYYAYVACESEDEVALVRLVAPSAGEPRLEVVKRIRIGVYDVEIEGPHGLGVSPDGKYWFLSIAHGRPYGILYKYRTDNDELVGEVELGMFPATMQISSATGLLHIVNFNLHGGHEPSTVSIVDPDEMVELMQIPQGIMPHGSRFSPDGMKHYSMSMMTDELFEIDAVKLAVTRTLNVHTGEGQIRMMHEGHGDASHEHEHGDHDGHADQSDHAADDHKHDAGHGKSDGGHSGHGVAQQKKDQHQTGHGTAGHGGAGHNDAGHGNAGHGNEGHSDAQHGKAQQADHQHAAAQHGQHDPELQHDHHAMAKPTWVQMHPTKPLAYVANNGANEVVEINLKEWKITRKFATGKGPYNVEITPDGTKFVVTYKSDAATGIWDIESGKELARVENSRKVPHGIAITPDSRFAIVTVEGIGGEPGGVDAIDLQTFKCVDVADVGKQAGGIAFWKMEEE